jgi:uncharacterized protein (TIGR00266 family)
MEFRIDHRPSFATATLTLAPGESVRAEAGAMLSHSEGVTIDTGASGGLLSSLKRSVLGGESFFQNTFTAPDTGGEVTLAPPLPGDLVQVDLDGTLYVQSGSYLASATSVSLDTAFGGGRTFFGGEGFFLLELSGTGETLLSSYGAIDERQLEDGETFVVDTGHVVAFDGTASFDVDRVGGLRSTLFSGEGLVCTFRGPGRVWTQSRSADAFVTWLIPKLPVSRSSST